MPLIFVPTRKFSSALLVIYASKAWTIQTQYLVHSEPNALPAVKYEKEQEHFELEAASVAFKFQYR